MSKNQNTNQFKWDAGSAFRKLTSGIDMNVCTPTPVISVCKTTQITPPNDPKKDAYRNCARCGKHYNYHAGGKCPK